MTRINTNVGSLIGRNNLADANASLSQSLTRLSTGLRINTGADDPAGLIASENLRSDITAINSALDNTTRAGQIIATADSALGEVSNLLNDIRGLVTESANSGALSADEIAANQLQVDSSLAALNRIAQTTTFQGRSLLDGSLDFLTTAGTNSTNISNLQIDQANLGATGQVAVDINVTTAATQASVDITGIDAASDASPATGDLSIDLEASPATADIDIDLVAQDTGNVEFDFANGTLDITTTATGAAGNIDNLTINVSQGTAGATFDSDTNTIDVTLDLASSTATDFDLTALAGQISSLSEFTAAVNSGSTGTSAATAETVTGAITGGRDASTETITVTTTATGTDANVDVTIQEGGTPGTSVDSSTGDLTVTIANTGTTSIADIAATIDALDGFSATTDSTGVFDTGDDTLPSATTLDGGAAAATETITITTAENFESLDVNLVAAAGIGATPTVDFDSVGGITVTVDSTLTTSLTDIAAALAGDDNITSATTSSTRSFFGGTDVGTTTPSTLTGNAEGIDDAVVFELSGSNGAEVLSFGAGTSVADLVAGINLVSDATGVTASDNSGTLQLQSSAFGTSAFVDINIISEGNGDSPAGTFTTAVGQGQRNVGTNVAATVNGVVATGNGNDISINTATLDLSASLTSGFTGTASFTIDGGGALFQLGPDVVSNQQARLGIGSVNTAQLGGDSGLLFQLGTGGTASLSEDPTQAAAIVEEAINQVTSLRGRLGAFQRTTLDTNTNALNDTLTNLAEAESAIRDADFAAETAELTRSQILVQSGTQVLAIANQNPQNVLALLG